MIDGIGYVADPDDLPRGVKLVNALLGLQLPVPRAPAGACPHGHEDASSADSWYLRLLGAMFGVPNAGPKEIPALLATYGDLFEPRPGDCVLEPAFEQVRATYAMSDEKLVAAVTKAMSVRVLDPHEILRPDGYVFLKINHYHWEYITFRALAAVKAEGHRPMDAQELLRVQHTRSDELVITSLQRLGADLRERGAVPGSYDHPGCSLAVSFNNGDGLLADDLVPPVPPIMRAAMVGCRAFFAGLMPAPHHDFSDGSFPKMLVWRSKMDEFFAEIRSKVDAIVFIVPDRLQQIAVRDWQGESVTIPVPSTMIAELWPVVLPVVASRLERVFAVHRRIFVAIQAGLISVPIGVLVQLMRRKFPATTVHCVDMGQAIDVAAYPGSPLGPWLRQPELQDTLERAGSFPVYLAD